MIDAQETHPLLVLPRIETEGTMGFGRYDTKFRSRSLNVVRTLAKHGYLEITHEANGYAHCVTGALAQSFTIVADNIITKELPHRALLLLEVSDELTNIASLIAVSDLHNCHMSFNHGKLTLTEAEHNQWVFDVQETGLGPVPNPDSSPFRVMISVLQDNSESRYRDQIHAVARSAAQHVRIMLPQTNVLAFDQEHMVDVVAQMDKLVALHHNGQHIAAEQLVRQTILACATRHAAC